MPNFTALPEYGPGQARRLSVDALLAMFKDRPLDFAPGTRFSYSNSGYALLGAIIEKVTQQPFAEALREYILVPIGARETRYDSAERIFPRRARGYERDGTGYRNAPYLDMSQPYAAGALVSTVDDLLTWDTALTSGRILKPESLAKMMAPFRLSDGTTTTYGYGWALADYAGHAVAEHSGGINGFRCHVVRIADANVYVAVLSNDGSPGRQANAPRTEDRVAPRRRAAHRAARDRAAAVSARSVRGPLALSERPVDHASRATAITCAMEGPAGDGVLYRRRGDQFQERGGVAQFEFRRDGDGRVNGVEQSGWGASRNGEQRPVEELGLRVSLERGLQRARL